MTGMAIVPTSGIVVLSAFLTQIIVKISMILQKRQLYEGDELLRNIWGCYNNIRFIKMEALENFFLTKIVSTKVRIMVLYIKKRLIDQTTRLINMVTSTMLMVCLFGFYIWFGNELNIASVFTILNIFNRFKDKIFASADLIKGITQCYVSARRMNNFLCSEEISDSGIEYLDRGIEDAVGGDNGRNGQVETLGDYDPVMFDTKFSMDQNNSKEIAIEIIDGNFYWVDKIKSEYIDGKRAEEKARNERKVCDCFGKKKADKKRGADKRVSIAGNITRAHTIDPLRESLLGSEENSENQDDKPKKVNGVIHENKPTEDKAGIIERDSLLDLDQTQTDFGQTSLIHDNDCSESTEKEDTQVLHLKNINIKIQKGACIAIIGKIGSGKSSLLNCLFGELYAHTTRDSTPRIRLSTDRISYVAQTTWLQSRTIKENVVFYDDYDQARFDDAIERSQMITDLAELPGGEATILGDKGVNLSGGQKVRLSLARALYANQDIILMDDPISALDVKVGKTIMEDTIIGHLAGKTRVIVTHAISYLSFFDHIYIMEDGAIVQEGSYETIQKTDEYQAYAKLIYEEEQEAEKEEKKLSKRTSGSSSDFLEKFISEAKSEKVELERKISDQSRTSVDANEANEANPDENLLEDSEAPRKTSVEDERIPLKKKDSMAGPKEVEVSFLEDPEVMGDKIISSITTSEDREVGYVAWGTKWAYILMRGGCVVFTIDIIILVFQRLFSFGRDYYTQYWTSLDDADRNPTDFLVWFSVFGLSENFLTVGRSVMLDWVTYFFGIKLIFLINFRLIYASVNKFWDRVPIGRVINRVIVDASNAEDILRANTSHGMYCMSVCVQQFLVVTITSSQWLWFAVLANAIICFFYYRYFM
jgi:ABC-type multidrug transport system fused ATPase/permease subunit